MRRCISGQHLPEDDCIPYRNSVTASTVLPSTGISVLGLYMKEFLHDLRALNAMSAFMLHMHIERHSFNIYVNFTSKLGQFCQSAF